MKKGDGSNTADLIGDALRVLKRLAVPGARLDRRADFYAVIGTGRAGRSLHVPLQLVEAMRRRDWLALNADGYILSDAGLGWLKRALEGEHPFAEQHRETMRTETAVDDATPAVVTVNDAESPIARLRAEADARGKPLIDDTQYLAGERLRRDFTLGQLAPRLAVDLTAPVVAGRRGAQHGELSDIALAARQRFSRAISALGPGLSDVAIDVCCHLKEPSSAESTQGWSDSAALTVLRIVLDRLAAHYGFVVQGTRPRVRAWRAPDEGADMDANGEDKKTARDP